MLLYNARKSNSGFTLIEMLVVFIIVGVIAAIAAPNFLGMLNQTRVKDGLAQVEGAVKEAQRQAMRRGKICKVKFVDRTIDGETRKVITVVESTDTGETIAAGFYNGCLLEERILPKEVEVDPGSITKITFSAKGNTDSDSNGIIQIYHPLTTTKKCIQIEGMLGAIFTGDYDSATNSCKAL